MLARSFRFWPVLLFVVAGLLVQTSLRGQDAAPPDAPAAVPNGVEVQARGPVHEAFATLTAEAQPTRVVAKRPPKNLEEMPPEDKPEGDVLWISGYWAWDDDRSDFLWVSGIWRTPPPSKQWVAGYWRDEADGAQWVPGFWTPAAKQDAPQDVTYLPQPPAPPQVAPPGAPPAADTFYVPGTWVWNNTEYAWRAGYWARVQHDYVWVSAHYRWTPGGYIYIAGYWDYTVKRRGVLYAPVFVDVNVVGASFVYTPAYAVPDTVVVDALFVRPSTCHYYFGDYYDVSYRDSGFTSCVVYSQTNYDSIVVYQRYEHRDDPTWINVQIDLFSDRSAGRSPVPPRTLNQQTTIIQQTVVNNVTNVNNVNNVTNNNVNNNVNNTTNNVTVNKKVMTTPVLVAPAKVMAAQGVKSVKLDSQTRQQVQQQSNAVQQVSVQRTKTEVAAPGGPPKQPHVAALNVPPSHPAAPKTAVAPAVTTQPTAPKTAVAPAVTTQPAGVPTTTLPTAKPTQPSVAPTAPTQKPTMTPTSPTVTTNPTHPTPTTPSSIPAKPTVSPAVTGTPTPTLPGTVKPTPTVAPPGPGVTPPSNPPTLAPPLHPPTPPPAKRPPPPPPKDKDKNKDKDKDKQQ
jgi:WXXGXW repeat (2 copies)